MAALAVLADSGLVPPLRLVPPPSADDAERRGRAAVDRRDDGAPAGSRALEALGRRDSCLGRPRLDGTRVAQVTARSRRGVA